MRTSHYHWTSAAHLTPKTESERERERKRKRKRVPWYDACVAHIKCDGHSYGCYGDMRLQTAWPQGYSQRSYLPCANLAEGIQWPWLSRHEFLWMSRMYVSKLRTRKEWIVYLYMIYIYINNCISSHCAKCRTWFHGHANEPYGQCPVECMLVGSFFFLLFELVQPGCMGIRVFYLGIIWILVDQWLNQQGMAEGLSRLLYMWIEYRWLASFVPICAHFMHFVSWIYPCSP